MKKMLFIVLVFVSLSGFRGQGIEASSMFRDLLLPPRVTSINPSNEFVVEEGNMTTFGINYVSEPSANVIIKKGTEILKPSSTCSMSMTGDEVIIYLKDVKPVDEGIYTITLDNDIGQTTARLILKVKKRII